MITFYTLLAGFAVLLTQIGIVEFLAVVVEARKNVFHHDTEIYPDYVYREDQNYDNRTQNY